MEVLDFLVEVSTGGPFYWVRIFESHVDVIDRIYHISKGVNLHQI